MRISIIDLGTNSVRFDVQQIGPNNRVKQLHREKLMVRLGQGVFIQGKLDASAVRRTVQAFQSFRATSDELGTDKIIAFGTSALREASDGDRLLRQIKENTGIAVRVISGQEEAHLIAKGILANEKLPHRRFALVDIGGGSTEISICQKKESLHSESFPLGTARLHQVFLKSSPPRADEKKREHPPIEQLRRYVKSVILPKVIAEEWPKVELIIGSSGTIRAVARLLKKKSNGKTVERDSLKKLVREMSTMNTSQLLGLPGMESKRVDMILAGAILLEECMDALHAKKVITTEFALREGVLQEERDAFQNSKSSTFSIHLQDLKQKAIQLGNKAGHLDHVEKLCNQLFDDLKPLHKLNLKWKTYLLAASYLHDSGEVITPTRHEIHSHYIVKNANFAGMEAWEVDFVAKLCLHHRSDKIAKDELERDMKHTREAKYAFLKLLAMLRIADALDRSKKSHVKITAIKKTQKEVRIQLKSQGACDLELLRVEQKKGLFENIFDRKLIVTKL